MIVLVLIGGLLIGAFFGLIHHEIGIGLAIVVIVLVVSIARAHWITAAIAGLLTAGIVWRRSLQNLWPGR